MTRFTRRDMLKLFALTPTLPQFVVESASAASAQGPGAYGGPVLVVVRFMGGNDGLNAVVPVNDDRYYRARPTIAIAKRDAITQVGGDLGLNPWLADYQRLIDDGHAAIVQGVGYPSSSRSHSRGTEIFEAGTVREPAPSHGWLGRYLDHQCECGSEPVAGMQFGPELGLTLASASGHSQSVAHPRLLLDTPVGSRSEPTRTGPRFGRLDYLRQVENTLAATAQRLGRAVGGNGGRYDYPDTEFGQALRWTGNLIETGAPTRVYYLTLGSFATFTSPSFDTHSNQLAVHEALYSQFGAGLRAFAAHLRAAGQFDRVLVMSFSEFGRQVEENRSHGTDHGDASVLFAAGGRVRPGLLGEPADLGRQHDGGLEPTVDFRQIYADVLARWLGADPAGILDADVQPFPVVL